MLQAARELKEGKLVSTFKKFAKAQGLNVSCGRPGLVFVNGLRALELMLSGCGNVLCASCMHCATVNTIVARINRPAACFYGQLVDLIFLQVGPKILKKLKQKLSKKREEEL